MTFVEVVAILVGAVLGWVSGTLKAQMYSLRGPEGSLGAGGAGHHVPTVPPRPRVARGEERRPRAAMQALETTLAIEQPPAR